MKIALISTYFGSLPNYFLLWLKTCANNPEVQFFLATDCDVPSRDLPPNVHIIRASLRDFKKGFSQIVGFPVNLERAYKVCDFRPIFGLYFADLLRGFDYWGHVDIDVLWGRIAHFLPQDLTQYDRIYRRGHFALFRNNEHGNNLFRLPHPEISYEQAFRSSKSECFDEGGIYWICEHNGISLYDPQDPIGDISYKSARLSFSFNGHLNARYQAFVIDEGKAMQIYSEGGEIRHREFMYFHFQKRQFPAIDIDQFRHLDSWTITPHGFIPGLPDVHSERDLDALNRPCYPHLVDFYRSAAKKRLSALLAR